MAIKGTGADPAASGRRLPFPTNQELAGAQHLESLVLALAELEDRNAKLDVVNYNAVVSACARGKLWERGLWLAAQTRGRGLEPSQASCNAAVSVSERGSQWGRALGLLADARHLGKEANVIGCSAGISTCEKSGEWQRALGLFQGMQEQVVEPSLGKAWVAAESFLPEECDQPQCRHQRM